MAQACVYSSHQCFSIGGFSEYNTSVLFEGTSGKGTSIDLCHIFSKIVSSCLQIHVNQKQQRLKRATEKRAMKNWATGKMGNGKLGNGELGNRKNGQRKIEQ